MNIKRQLAKNKAFAILYGVLSTTALLCISGPLMQTFLLEIGVGAERASLHATLLQATSLSTIVLFSRFADKGRIIRRAALCFLPQGALFLCYLPLCLSAPNPTVAFLAATGVGVLQTFFTSLHTVCNYKLPYFIYRPSDFGLVASVGGIVGALLSLGIGALVSGLTERYPYPRLMLFLFALSCLLMLGAALCTFALRVLPSDITAAGLSAKLDTGEGEEKKKVSLLKMFRMPIFLHLLPSNLCRGFASGVTLVFAILAVELGHGPAVATALTSVQSAATLLGCLFHCLLF